MKICHKDSENALHTVSSTPGYCSQAPVNTSFKDVDGTNDTYNDLTKTKNYYAKISQNLYILSHAKSTYFIRGKVVTFPDLVKQF